MLVPTLFSLFQLWPVDYHRINIRCLKLNLIAKTAEDVQYMVRKVCSIHQRDVMSTFGGCHVHVGSLTDFKTFVNRVKGQLAWLHFGIFF